MSLTEHEARSITARRAWKKWLDAHTGLVTAVGVAAMAAIVAAAVTL